MSKGLIARLTAERARMQTRLAAIDSAIGLLYEFNMANGHAKVKRAIVRAETATPAPTTGRTKTRRRSTLSKAGRLAISRAQRARWAKIRTEKTT